MNRMMPTPSKRPCVRGKDVAAPAMVLSLLAIIGCPSNPAPGGPGITGVDAPTASATQQASSVTPAPAIVWTPAPVYSPNPAATSHNDTPPPQILFATPTPTPTPRPSPALEALDLQIFEGSAASNYAQNLFIVPAVGDLPHLDPPASRSYAVFNDIGIGVGEASTSGFPQEIVSTASVPATWTIGQVVTMDVHLPATASLPAAVGNLIFFRLPGGATASSVAATDTVEIDVATVSSGVLLTFSANVTAQTGQVFDGPASPSATLAILASNEGQISLTVSSLRLPHLAQMTP